MILFKNIAKNEIRTQFLLSPISPGLFSPVSTFSENRIKTPLAYYLKDAITACFDPKIKKPCEISSHTSYSMDRTLSTFYDNMKYAQKTSRIQYSKRKPQTRQNSYSKKLQLKVAPATSIHVAYFLYIKLRQNIVLMMGF